MKRVLAILVLWSVWVGAQTNGLDFKDLPSGVSLQLPAGWTAVTQESLYRVAGIGAKLEPTPPPREFLAVFLRGSEVQHPGFPRIIMQVQKNARVGETQFQGLHAAPLVEITVAESLGFAGRPELMKPAHYDPQKQCLEFSFDCPREDSSLVHAAGRSFLTAEGLVNLYGYAPSQEFEAFKPEFEAIVSTFQLSPEHRYQPGSAGKKNPTGTGVGWKEVGTVLSMMILAGIGWIVAARMRDRVWSDEI